MTQQKSGTGSGSSGGTVTMPQAVTEHLQTISQNPTDFQNYFREIVGRASAAGVSQQQLLDWVADNYRSGGSTNR